MRIPFWPGHDLWDLKRRWAKRLARWRRRLAAWHDRRRRLYERLTSAIERVEKMAASYEDASFSEAVKRSVARAVLSELGKETDIHQELLSEVRKELLASCRADALVLARAELASEFEELRVRLEDRLARQQKQYQQEAEASIEAGIDKALKAQGEDWLAEISRGRRQRNQAREERDQAVDVLASLARQIFGPSPTKVYAYSRGISELDVAGLNAALAAKRLRVRCVLTSSERQVRVRMTAGSEAEPRTIFWIEGLPPDGVEIEDDSLPAPLVSQDAGVSAATWRET